MFIVNTAKSWASSLLTTYLLGQGADTDSLQKVVECMSQIPEASKKLDKLTKLKYLVGYNKLQDIMRDLSPELVYGPQPENPILGSEKHAELDEIANDCAFYARFAVGCYGDKVLYQQGTTGNKNVLKLLDPNDHNDEFAKFGKFDRRQIFHSNWSVAKAYEPAHAILVLKERREVVVVIRGSVDIGDWLTDFIASYLTFSVMENEKGNRYIKVHTTDSQAKDIIEKLDPSKNILDDQKDSSKDKVIYTGRAHSGIFKAGIKIYNELRSYVSFDIFCF